MGDPPTHRRTPFKKHPPLPTSASSDHLSPSRIIRALRTPISRPCMLLLVLSGLGILVMTANFVFTLRATSVARESAKLLENTGGLNLNNSGLRPPRPDNRDAFSADDVKRMENELVYTIHETAQRTSEPRGIVLPLYDDIATLGVSLILELRAMDVDLPIEIPHCGDLKDSTIRAVLKKTDMGVLYFYNVCERAFQTVSLLDASVKVFCQSLPDCHKSFRGFDIKLLAVTFSRFEEIMLLDADTLFFQSPMSLWNTDKYQSTGTLFFHDRIIEDDKLLGKRNHGRKDVRDIHDYMSRFNVSLFEPLGYIERPKATSENKVPVKLNFSPSEHLLTSHSWNYRTGHQMDSSLVLWNKKRQPRATAMLASFVALNRIDRPHSYGEKELFFVAAELAETQYAFSDFGVGGSGWDFRDYGRGKSVLCGRATHYYPVRPKDAEAVANASVLYLNSDDIMVYDPKTKPMYYSQARLKEVYPGDFRKRHLPMLCAFDVTGVRFSPEQENHMLLRQRFHEIVEAWME